jgi:hypothetical protein
MSNNPLEQVVISPMRFFFICMTLAACGGAPASSTPPAPTTAPSFLHPELCNTSQQQCDVGECEKWKVDHGEDQEKAHMECPQVCGCAE